MNTQTLPALLLSGRTHYPNATLDYYVHGNGTGKTKMFYVVLRANRIDGFWEAPIRERHATGLFSSKRKKIAAKLHADIQVIFKLPT